MVPVMSMSYLNSRGAPMGFNVGLAVGWEGGKLWTTLTFWASATGSIEAGGAVPPEMGGGWFLGSMRYSGVRHQVGDAL